MKIVGPDGKTYEVKATEGGDRYDVSLGGDVVATFELEADDIPVRLHAKAAGRTTVETVRGVAEEFSERGGGTMRIC